MRKRALAFGALALCATMLGPTRVEANSSSQVGDAARLLFAYKSGLRFKLWLEPGTTASINCARPIRRAVSAHENPLVDVRKSGHSLNVAVHEDTEPNMMVDVEVDFGIRTIFLELHISAKEKADRLVEVLAVDQGAFMAEVDKHAKPMIEAAREEEQRKRLRAEGKQAWEEFIGEPMYRDQLVPHYTTTQSSEQLTSGLKIYGGKWDTDNQCLLVPFELEHHDAKGFGVATIEGTSGVREVEVELVDVVGTTLAGVPAESGEPLAQVENETVLRGVLAVRYDEQLGLKDLNLQFSEREGGRWIRAEIAGWKVVRVAFAKKEPPRKETPKERFMREVQEEEQREARAEQVIVGLLVAPGACWLTDGLGGNAEKVNAAPCLEVGARLTYPVMVPDNGGTNLAVEAELTGVLLGDVNFEDVMVDGAVGNLVRSSTLGRAVAGLALRFGDRKITYLRFGWGLQGASNKATFSAGEGPDTSFDLGVLWVAGGGVELRMGDRFLLGGRLSVTWNASASDDILFRRAVQAGLHLRYGWNQ